MIMREKAYSIIRDAITFGELFPGEKLVEADLCERFQIGRTPLREALLILQAEGYIDVSPNKGATIRKISIVEIEQVNELLIVLESLAVEKATARIKNDDILKIGKINSKFIKAAEIRSYKDWMAYNDQFHNYLWKASNSPVLMDEIIKLRSRVYRSRGLEGTFVGKNIHTYIREHEKIISAIASGNPVKAAEAMKAHLSSWKTIVSAYLREK